MLGRSWEDRSFSLAVKGASPRGHMKSQNVLILLFLIFLFKISLVYNAVFVSGIQKNDSVIHVYSFLGYFP